MLLLQVVGDIAEILVFWYLQVQGMGLKISLVTYLFIPTNSKENSEQHLPKCTYRARTMPKNEFYLPIQRRLQASIGQYLSLHF